MKKLMIAVSLLMVAGSAMAETWKDGNSAPVDVTFAAPDTIQFSGETHLSFNKTTPLLKSTMLGAVTASKAGSDGAGIRFKWAVPYKQVGEEDVTDFRNTTTGTGAIAVRLMDTQMKPLLPAEEDASGWFKVEGQTTDKDVTVQFYPEKDVGVQPTAGLYTAEIQAAVYSN